MNLLPLWFVSVTKYENLMVLSVTLLLMLLASSIVLINPMNLEEELPLGLVE